MTELRTNKKQQIKLSRTKNTARNILAGTLNKVITLLLPFIVRTVFIKNIGIEFAGLNSLFTSILQVLNISELGFSTAIVYSMYKPIADNDKESICALLSFFKKAYLIIGLIVFAVGCVIAPFLSYLIHGNIPSGINIYILFFIFLINTCISYILFGYKQSLFNAYQRQDILSNIMSVTHGLMSVCQIIVLILFKSYYLYIIFLPISTIANNVIVAFETKRRFPEYKPIGKISVETRKEINKKVSGLMITRVCQITRNTFDSIFISAFIGLSVTAIYNNYYLLINSVTGFVGILSNSMLAGIGNSIETESVEKNWKDMKKFNFLYMWISGWCTACLLCLYQPFMKLWMGEEYMFSINIVILLCWYFYEMKLSDINTTYYSAKGLWWEGKWRAVIESIMNIILNLVLVIKFEVAGIIIATIVSHFLINFLYGNIFVFKYYLGKDKIKFWYLIQLCYTVVTALICVGTYLLCDFISRLININTILEFLIRAIICIIVPNVLFFIFYSHTKEFKNTEVWLKGLKNTDRKNILQK